MVFGLLMAAAMALAVFDAWRDSVARRRRRRNIVAFGEPVKHE